ncbi:MAG: NERD domain-containing protein/DEAD/DEAH box helicase [Cellvibrionaceae bacterium]|nr:NERD domain-containing protein/DEAD/DEAH box helicase [Cellvibrionaceae bacterium]
MAKLIPSLSSCISRMTSGEKRFARRLEGLLEDDYLCWFDIPLGAKRRYPDFIVLHPSRGILFLEVKDWKAANIKRISHSEVELETPTGRKTVSNPIEQARQCSYQVLQVLERDPQLKQLMGKHKGKLCFPYGYGAVFTNITRKQLDKGIPEEHRHKLLPGHLLICQDEMTDSATAEDFQERLWGMFNYQFGNKLTLPQIDRIRWHLFPEIRIESIQDDLFAGEDSGEDALEPTLVESMPDIVKIMDVQQEQLARSLGDGHRVVHGVAGSGKTLILGYRCLYLAEALNKPILVLCFNITLAARLRSFISEKGINDKVQVYHFHDWCGEQLRAYHVDLMNSNAPVWERQVSTVIDAVDKGHIPKGQYGAVLIDEGHDFEAEWLTLIAQMVDPDTDSLLLLYDDAQSIYKRKSSLGFSLSSVGIKAQGRTTILRLNYRNTREIIEFAYNFAKDYFSQTGESEIPLIEPEAAGNCGAEPFVKGFRSLEEEVAFSIRCLKAWHAKGKSWRDIAILYPGGSAGKLMVAALKDNGIPSAWLATSQYKKRYKPDAERVSVMPIPSSKGLEFDTVIILDSSYQSSYQEDQDANLADDVRRLYVGLTRAQEQLLVCHHRTNQLSEMLAS